MDRSESASVNKRTFVRLRLDLRIPTHLSPSPGHQAKGRGYDAAVTRANRPAAAQESHDVQDQPPSDADRIAELEEQVQQLRAALEARGRRLAADQLVYADHFQAQTLVIARLQEDIKILEAEIEGRKQAYDDVVNTRTFRYTTRLRALYGTARKWLGLR
jgi:hypothetical protein